MAWTTPRTWIFDETPGASTLNTHIRDNFNFLAGLKRGAVTLSSLADGSAIAPYTLMCDATHSVNLSIPHGGGGTTVSLNTDVYDPDAFHDPVTNNNRLTVPSGMAGVYLVLLEGWLSGSGSSGQTGSAQAHVRKNGSVVKRQSAAIAYDPTLLALVGTARVCSVETLAAGDYIDFAVQQSNQNSGALSLNGNSVYLRATLWKLKD